MLLKAELEDSYKILPPTSNGMVHRFGLYVPEFTVKNNPEFATYRGFVGKENRRALANHFLKPINFGEYCSVIKSEEECASGNDTTAKRLPTEEEEGLYFLRNTYHGYFHNSTEIDCDDDNFEEKCFGHYINEPCDRYGKIGMEAMIFWNDIPMKAQGPLEFGRYDWRVQVCHFLKCILAPEIERST